MGYTTISKPWFESGPSAPPPPAAGPAHGPIGHPAGADDGNDPRPGAGQGGNGSCLGAVGGQGCLSPDRNGRSPRPLSFMVTASPAPVPPLRPGANPRRRAALQRVGSGALLGDSASPRWRGRGPPQGWGRKAPPGAALRVIQRRLGAAHRRPARGQRDGNLPPHATASVS